MEIELTKGLKCLIDLEDYEKVSRHKWYAHRSSSESFYAATRGKLGSDLGLNKFVYLHRYLLNPSKGQIVDHINGDMLDNRRSNLRLTDLKGNSRNSRKQSRKLSSIYKGVHFMKRDSVWVAQIDGTHIGRYNNEEEAAKAYNEKALILYGRFAKINEL